MGAEGLFSLLMVAVIFVIFPVFIGHYISSYVITFYNICLLKSSFFCMKQWQVIKGCYFGVVCGRMF